MKNNEQNTIEDDEFEFGGIFPEWSTPAVPDDYSPWNREIEADFRNSCEDK